MNLFDCWVSLFKTIVFEHNLAHRTSNQDKKTLNEDSEPTCTKMSKIVASACEILIQVFIHVLACTITMVQYVSLSKNAKNLMFV